MELGGVAVNEFVMMMEVFVGNLYDGALVDGASEILAYTLKEGRVQL